MTRYLTLAEAAASLHVASRAAPLASAVDAWPALRLSRSPTVSRLDAASSRKTASGSAGGGSYLMARGMDLFTALVVGAPALLVATGATVAVALVRGLGRHRALV